MKEIFSQVIDSLNMISEKKSTRIVFSSPKYKPVDFDAKNFHEIKEQNQNCRMLFVDGGNAVLLESPSFSVHFLRVFGHIMQGRQKLFKEKSEFVVVVKSGNENFAVEVYPMEKNKKRFCFSLSYPVKTEEENFVSKAANDVRRFFELQLAAKIAELKLEKNDIVVLDGTLKTRSSCEAQFFANLCMTAEQKKLVLCSLAKTTNLVTDSGDSALVYLSGQTDLKQWYYYPVADINDDCHKAEICIAKLNKNSGRVFRLEAYKNHKHEVDFDCLFSAAAENSKDPVFLGYPYGLIFADSHARVSNKEKEYLRTIFLKDRRLEQYAKTLDAHDVLDSINF